MTEKQCEELKRLAELRDKGLLSDEEFTEQKKTIMSGGEEKEVAAVKKRNDSYNIFLTTHSEYFDPLSWNELKERLSEADEKQLSQLNFVGLKNPSTMFWMAFLLGGFGVDRFMLGDTALGVLKFFIGWMTFGVWWLADLFTVKKRTWLYNYKCVMLVL